MTGQINHSVQRPKLQQFQTISVPLDFKTSVNDTTKTKLERICFKDLDASAAVAVVNNCTTINGQKKITTTGTFEKVRVGDQITGTNVGASAVVEAVINDQEIRASVVSSAGGLTNLTFTPPGEFDATMLAIKVTTSTRLDPKAKEPYLDITIDLLDYDGSLTDANADGDDNATVEQGSPVQSINFSKNVQSFLRKARVPDPS